MNIQYRRPHHSRPSRWSRGCIPAVGKRATRMNGSSWMDAANVALLRRCSTW